MQSLKIYTDAKKRKPIYILLLKFCYCYCYNYCNCEASTVIKEIKYYMHTTITKTTKTCSKGLSTV